MKNITQEELYEKIKQIQMYKVESSNIVALGYDAVSQMLRVIFKGNSSYVYFEVEPEIWVAISSAESKGKALNESIIRQKEKYKFIKLL